MVNEFYTLLTEKGMAKIASALADKKQIHLQKMAVGDSNGQYYEPTSSQTQLRHEVWRGEMNTLTVEPNNPNWLIAEVILPEDVGGWYVREVGVFDTDGELIAIGKFPESYKPLLPGGSGKQVCIRLIMEVSNTTAVTLTVDPSVVLATRDYVDSLLDEHEHSTHHPDATLTQKGFAQLSNATDSDDETKAATPKAVKAANDNANGRVPAGRKINGHALTEDISITAQDIFNGQTVGIGGAADLNTYITPGLYYQPANVQAASGKNYPEPNAGSLEVYKHAGITQVYRVYNNSRQYIRTFYNGTWTAWSWVYDTTHKPTAVDVGSLPVTGGTVTGNITVNGYVRAGNSRILELSSSNTSSLNGVINLWGNTDRPTVLEFKDATGYHFYSQRNKNGSVSLSFNGAANFGGGITSSGEIISKAANGIRISYGNYGTFWRNDGSNLYLMLTNQGDPLGNYNALRPFTVNLASGDVTINKLALANYANFDSRYYTKAQSDSGYMAKTAAYTKTESDGRFQPKGNYTPAGQSYTKAESNGRYVQNIRVGALGSFVVNANVWSEAPVGAFMTGWYAEGQNPGGDSIHYRPIQININGTWRTITA